MNQTLKTKFRRIMRTLTASVLCCAFTALSAFALDATVDTTTLNVRSETSIKSAAIGKVYRGQSVEITGRLGNWYSIDFEGQRGFVFVDYLAFDQNYIVDIGYGVVTTSSEKTAVNLREEPSIDSSRVTRLMPGTKVRVLGYTDGWYYIRFVDYYGYISADYLKLSGLTYSYAKDPDPDALDPDITEDLPNSDRNATLDETLNSSGYTIVVTPEKDSKPTAKQEETTAAKAPAETTTAASTTTTAASSVQTPESTSTLRQEIVDYAKSFLGTKYVYGGSSPSTGFDCSGLTQYVYAHFGYTINRCSAAQINNGTKITKDELQPGDLVFFSRAGYSVGHVGIYIGNGQFLHAPRTGDVVKISSLSETYYTNRYVGARRILSE